MLLITIYCCSVHVFFPAFSLTVMGKCHIRECNDHCIVYKGKYLVVKPAKWMKLIPEKWSELSWRVLFGSVISSIMNRNTWTVFPQSWDAIQLPNDAHATFRVLTPIQRSREASSCIWRKIMEKALLSFCFSCTMVIVNVCKLEYGMQLWYWGKVLLKKSVFKVTARKTNWEVLLFKLTGVYFIVSAILFFCQFTMSSFLM